MLLIILLVALGFAPGVASSNDDFATSSLSASVNATPCPQNWFYSLELDKCYYISTNFSSFPDARKECAEIYHAELVSVYSKFEYDFISAQLEQLNFGFLPARIGLQNTCYGSVCYHWLDDSAANFTFWVNGTNPPMYNKLCYGWLKTKADDGWMIADCQQPLPYICKRERALDSHVIVNGTSGHITSPKYPVPYDPDVTTYYYITVPQGNVIDLTFYFVHIDSESYISIYDGLSPSAKLLQNITSANQQSILESTSNTLLVKFVASGTSGGNYWGWFANFTAVTPITFSGMMMSPNYPQNYGNNEFINLTVRAPENFGVIFEIWDFCTEPGDFLKITDIDGGREWLHSNCDTSGQSIWMDIDELVVTWSTDSEGTNKGFNMTWTAFPNVKLAKLNNFVHHTIYSVLDHGIIEVH
uniref:C-type lectin domain-containing protein n=1 Tax=Panagrellus redivivus TaxID=6233 RepID=A0A7E4VX39_PANRE